MKTKIRVFISTLTYSILIINILVNILSKEKFALLQDENLLMQAPLKCSALRQGLFNTSKEQRFVKR